MGLEIVELIMAYEQEFDIQIPAEQSFQLMVLGDMHAFIVQATRSKIPAPDPESIWEKMVEITVEQLSINPALIRKESHYIKDLGCG